MHADNQHILVVGAIEYHQLSPSGNFPVRPPQVVVIELRARGRLEIGDSDPLRVDPFEHPADRPVLARRIHCLEDDEDLVPMLSVEDLLQGVELPRERRQLDGSVLLSALYLRRIVRIPVLQSHSGARQDDILFHE